MLLFLTLLLPPLEGPNILFFIADDWSWLHAGTYGDAVVRTPNLDRLAREGLVFEHAFVSSPSCTPSRAAIATGQHFWRLGAGANLYGPLPAAHPVYADLLEEAGYHVGFTRKGWAPGRLGERERNPAGDRYESFDSFLSAREGDAPFAFWFGTHDPHRVYERGSGEASGLVLESIALPGVFPDTPPVRSDVADYYYEVERLDRELGELLALIEAGGMAGNTLVVVTSDNGMPFPRAKGNLYDLGTRVPLVMYWPGVIGEGRRVADLVSLTDLAPTFLEAAGLEPPRAMTGRSLMPILRAEGSGLADSTRTHVFFGRERHTPAQESPTMGGYPMRAVRTADFLYIYNFHPERWPAGTPHEERAFVSGAWLSDTDDSPTKHAVAASDMLHALAYGKRPGEELYDLSSDPEQVRNLALNAAYAAAKRSLWHLLFDELQATGDLRVMGRGAFYDRQTYTGGVVRRPDL